MSAFSAARLAQQLASISCKNGRMTFSPDEKRLAIIMLSDITDVDVFHFGSDDSQITFYTKRGLEHSRVYGLHPKMVDTLCSIVRENGIPEATPDKNAETEGREYTAMSRSRGIL